VAYPEPAESIPRLHADFIYGSQGSVRLRLVKTAFRLKVSCKYRKFHLKRDPNYYKCTFMYKTTKQTAVLNPLLQMMRCLNQHGRNSAVSSLDGHLLQKNTSCFAIYCYQSVYCCLVRYFSARMRIAKCFTKSSKRFRCEVMFENEHATRFVRQRTMFAPAQLFRNWREQRPSNQVILTRV
jgi:hypothetical protein